MDNGRGFMCWVCVHLRTNWTNLRWSSRGGCALKLPRLLHISTRGGGDLKSKLSHFLQWEISTFYSGVGRGMTGRRIMTSPGGGAKEDENSILHQREESCREGRGEGGDRCLREGRRDERHWGWQRERERQDEASASVPKACACVRVHVCAGKARWRVEPWWGKITCWPSSSWTTMVGTHLLLLSCREGS